MDTPRLSADPANFNRQAPAPQATPDPRFNVGVMDTPRLSADPTNGIGAYPGAGVPGLPVVKDQSRLAQGIKEYGTFDRIAPAIKDQSRIAPETIPGPESRMLNSYGVSTADALQNGLVENAAAIAGRPTTPRNLPASLGPTYGPETPAGPEGWQQGTSIDPTASTPLDYATEILKNTPVARATRGIIKVIDAIEGGPAYREDVSLGTGDSGKRTDRPPSQGGGYSPGSFGPGGQDRGGQPGTGGREQRENRAFIEALPDSERQRLRELARTDFRTFMEELRRLKAGGAAPPGTIPTTPPPVNPMQWTYPQYTQNWAGLPTGLGGTYGRA